MQVPCDQCGKMLERPPSRVKANKHQFCDKACFDAFQVRRVQVECSVCGITMEVHPSKWKTNKHFACSPTCSAELSRRNRIVHFQSADRRVAACENCGKEFERKPSQMAKYKHSFCGRACKREWQRGQRKPGQVKGNWYPCEACSIPVWRTPATLRDRVFCSRECAQRIMPTPDHTGYPGLRGPDAPNWQGGKSLLPYTPGFTRMVSRQIRERDDNQCQLCGKPLDRPGELIAHHVDFSKDNHDPDNLITLCRPCHGHVHAQMLDLSNLRTRTV